MRSTARHTNDAYLTQKAGGALDNQAHSRAVPIRFTPASTSSLGSNNLVVLIGNLIDPIVWVACLWAVAFYFEGTVTPKIFTVSVLVFSLTVPGKIRLQSTGLSLFRSILSDWLFVSVLLLLFGYVSNYIYMLDRRALLTWVAITPFAQLAANLILRSLRPSLINVQGESRRVIIVGLNHLGKMLEHEFAQSPYVSKHIVGFVDEHHTDRVHTSSTEQPLLGSMAELPALIKIYRIDDVYVCLPMSAQASTLQLLEALGDTTASIHFVPDVLTRGLMHGRVDSLGHFPIITVCESPFTGLNGLVKRVADVILSLMIIIAISPIVLAAYFTVKLSSPGPAIFKQRRYGLNGDEFFVYKFRSMTMCEDQGDIHQATKNDQRITRAGAFMRKTSLDELPQFFNVLRGDMSIVGPRPHAVAHNEIYRKSIKGYMFRHKVKPGITGWAQVNGWRGETDTLDKMKVRIEYDLAYLRNWSLRLDFYIIFKTALLVFKDEHAY